MDILWDAVRVVLVVALVLGMAVEGYLGTTQLAVLLLVFVIFRSYARGRRMGGGLFAAFDLGLIIYLVLIILRAGGGGPEALPVLGRMLGSGITSMIELGLRVHPDPHLALLFFLGLFVLERIIR